MASIANKRRAEPAAFGEDGRLINVIIETPKGCRNKFAYEPKSGRFVLTKVLPAGSAFPYDFGFVPGTKAADGDPLDVLVLMDEPAYPGCIVTARPIGVMEAEQTEDGATIRNDRVIAVAEPAHDYGDLETLHDVNANLLKELEDFFIHYNQTIGRQFRLLDVRGPKRAKHLIKESLRSRRKRKSRGT